MLLIPKDQVWVGEREVTPPLVKFPERARLCHPFVAQKGYLVGAVPQENHPCVPLKAQVGSFCLYPWQYKRTCLRQLKEQHGGRFPKGCKAQKLLGQELAKRVPKDEDDPLPPDEKQLLRVEERQVKTE